MRFASPTHAKQIARTPALSHGIGGWMTNTPVSPFDERLLQN
jgi:hypothetical protein